MKLSKLKVNPDNPQKFDDLSALKRSIKEFPKMLELRPMVYDPETGYVLGGNKRLICLKELGYKEIPNEWVRSADTLTEDEKRRFVVQDNIQEGVWDFDILAENYETEELEAWGLDETKEEKQQIGKGGRDLKERFVVPPLSILDTRQGYWNERKRAWRELIGDNGESRKETLFNSKGNPVSDQLRTFNGGVSLFDPVLAELINSWFAAPESKTFDPFAGDTIFGFVSDYLGHSFTGIELREQQVYLNNQRIRSEKSKYVCDDGQNVLKHIPENSQDLLFSCPPYFDLEKYSDLPNDASNQKSYSEFLTMIENVFSDSVKCLKENRFAVVVVGDVRNKENGFYYNFPEDVIRIFTKNGMHLYNRMILVENIGTAVLRVNGMMKTRKVVKTHQNVLCFYKGDDPKKVKEHFPNLDYDVEDMSEIKEIEDFDFEY